MIVFLGSPLLDIIVYVDKDFLNKYNLKADSTIRKTPELKNVFEEVLKMKPIIQPGGSVINTVRVFQWISRQAYPLVSIGCVGKDKYGQMMKRKMEDENIHCDFFEIPDLETGKVAVLLTNEDRTMVSELGAARKFSEELLTDHVRKHFEEAEYFYVSAHSLGFCFNSIKKLVDYFNDKKKRIIVNLAAAFLSKKYSEDLQYLFENADIVCGNEKEYKALYSIRSDSEVFEHEILQKLNDLFPNKPARLMIMTRGKNPVYIFYDNKLKEFEILPISRDKIVDTNSCGDAFIGGFLAQYVNNKSIQECVDCGLWASREIIQQHGCNFDKNKVYKT